MSQVHVHNEWDPVEELIVGTALYATMPHHTHKTYPHLLALAWFPRHQHPPYFSALINACV